MLWSQSEYDLFQNFPSTWELLWEDDRYAEGVIPEEESFYLTESEELPKEPPKAP